MRPTPHYPPAQSSTSARKDLYNAYGGGNGDAPQNGAEYAEYYNNSGKRGATSSDRSSNRPRPSLGSAQQQQRSNRSPQCSAPAVQQQQQQQQLYQQQQQNANQIPSMDDDYNSVVYTVQDTHTDTQAHETDYGGVLTIRTTTVTRTITERLVRSDEDEDSSDDDGKVHMEQQYRTNA